MNNAAKPIIDFDNAHLARDASELLPRFTDASIPEEKLAGYVLNTEHPSGKNKALVFESALGYNISNQADLVSRVRYCLSKYRAEDQGVSEYGRRFRVEMMVRGANGKYAPVVTAWQIDHGGDTPRLISMYVNR